MKNMTPELAAHMADSIAPLAEKQVLLPKTAQEIFADQDHWFPKFAPDGTLLGFFQYRTYPNDTQLAEMGSVLVLKPRQGVGQCLLQIFNTQKDIMGASGGFAVTKDWRTAFHFFAEHTGGDIYEPEAMPAWFKAQRACADRYFVQWK